MSGVFRITEEARAHARAQAEGRCECQGANCRHHRAGARCPRGLRGDQWKVYWRSENGGIARENIEAWCQECFKNNFTVPTSTVTILCSGISGYGGLVDDDRRRALTLVSVFRDAADRVAEDKQGRLLKTVTAEVWLEFPNSAVAMDAARDLETRFQEYARRLSLPTPRVCSGIHCAEVTRSRTGDLVGDTLPVAALVKGVAEAGQIVVSASVAEQLDRRIQLDELGDRVLDLPRPLSCWAVRL